MSSLRRYAERHPAQTASNGKPIPPVPASADAEMPAGAVFLSYASQDLPAVQNLHAALTTAERGRSGSTSGNSKRAICFAVCEDPATYRACSLFLPVVSANTQARQLKGISAWNGDWPPSGRIQIADTVPFILPITIDQTGAVDALVPEAFQTSQWSQLPAGEISPDVAARLIRLVRDYFKHGTRGKS